jgi:hypothetical protein
MRVTAYVRSEDASDPGYYFAIPSIGDRVVRGVSIKGTSLSSTDIVGVVQCGIIGSDDEYGFAPLGSKMASTIQFAQWEAKHARHTNPAGATLNELCRRAGRIEVRYRPGTVTAIAGDRLTVVMDGTGKTERHVAADDVTFTDFQVNDRVVVGYYRGNPRVDGWWQPGGAGGLYGYEPVDAFSVYHHEPAGNPTRATFGPYKVRRRWTIDGVWVRVQFLPETALFPTLFYVRFLGVYWLMTIDPTGRYYTAPDGRVYQCFRNGTIPPAPLPTAKVVIERNVQQLEPMFYHYWPSRIQFDIPATAATETVVGGLYR